MKFMELCEPENTNVPIVFTNELKIIHKRLKDGDAFPLTSSAGRLFDAVASIIGLRQICKFEGQSAMELGLLLVIV